MFAKREREKKKLKPYSHTFFNIISCYSISLAARTHMEYLFKKQTEGARNKTSRVNKLLVLLCLYICEIDEIVVPYTQCTIK